MCWSGTGTGVTLALMQYHNTPGFKIGTRVLRAEGASPRSCESSSHLYIAKILPGGNFIKFGSLAPIGGETDTSREAGSWHKTVKEKPFLHHASCRCLGDLRVEGAEKQIRTVIVLYVQLVRHDPCDSLVSVSESTRPLQCDYGQANLHTTPPFSSAAGREAIRGPVELHQRLVHPC